ATVHGVGFVGSLLEQTGVQVVVQLAVLPAVHRLVVSEEHTPLKTDPSQVSLDVSWITLSPQIVHWSVVPGARHVLLSNEVFPTQVGHWHVVPWVGQPVMTGVCEVGPVSQVSKLWSTTASP